MNCLFELMLNRKEDNSYMAVERNNVYIAGVVSCKMEFLE
jgi:hypothetical protein